MTIGPQGTRSGEDHQPRHLIEIEVIPVPQDARQEELDAVVACHHEAVGGGQRRRTLGSERLSNLSGDRPVNCLLAFELSLQGLRSSSVSQRAWRGRSVNIKKTTNPRITAGIPQAM